MKNAVGVEITFTKKADAVRFQIAKTGSCACIDSMVNAKMSDSVV